MKKVIQLMFVSMLMIFAAPTYSAQVAQVYSCEQDDDATEQDLRELASTWLKSARTMKGGENLEVNLYFPVAATLSDDSDFLYVVLAPSFEEWGVFWDGYEGSSAANADKDSADKAICPSSALWERIKVE